MSYDSTGNGETILRAGYGIFYDAFSQDIFLGHVPYNCVFCPGPAYTGVGIAPIGFASANSGPITSNVPVYGASSPLGDFFGVAPNIATPYVQNWNLNIEQQLTNKIMLQVSYVGSKGTKLFRFRDINQPNQGAITSYDVWQQCGGPYVYPNCPVYDYGVPRTAYPNFFYVNQEESTANSIYNALQTSLKINSWHGLSLQANYAWSHSIDNASDLEDFIPNAAQPNNSLAPQLERGNSNFDIRNRFSLNFSYQLPKFAGEYQKLKNGWGMDGILNLQDGQPFSFNYNFEGDYSGAGEGFDRPDVVDPVVYGNSPANYINLSSFVVPCTFGNTTNDGSSDASNCLTGTRHFGDLRRNSLRGPIVQGVQLLGVQGHPDHRAREPATPGRVLQPVQPSQLRQSGAAELHRRSRSQWHWKQWARNRLLRSDRDRRRGHWQPVPRRRRPTRHSVRRQDHLLEVAKGCLEVVKGGRGTGLQPSKELASERLCGRARLRPCRNHTIRITPRGLHSTRHLFWLTDYARRCSEGLCRPTGRLLDNETSRGIRRSSRPMQIGR